MENSQNRNNQENEQNISLINRKCLTISGTNKIISLSPELIQLNTTNGNLLILGNNLELIQLDNTTTIAEITGKINNIKFAEIKNKEPFFRKLFKWYSKHKIN